MYSAAKAGTASGYSYADRKIENFSTETDDILISSLQPKSALLKVLFEPNSKLVDSVTYDITAWSVPYVYGLTAYASRQSIAGAGNWEPKQDKIANGSGEYGFALKWNGVPSVRAVCQLLKQGV